MQIKAVKKLLHKSIFYLARLWSGETSSANKYANEF